MSIHLGIHTQNFTVSPRKLYEICIFTSVEIYLWTVFLVFTIILEVNIFEFFHVVPSQTIDLSWSMCWSLQRSLMITLSLHSTMTSKHSFRRTGVHFTGLAGTKKWTKNIPNSYWNENQFSSILSVQLSEKAFSSTQVLIVLLSIHTRILIEKSKKTLTASYDAYDLLFVHFYPNKHNSMKCNCLRDLRISLARLHMQ